MTSQQRHRVPVIPSCAGVPGTGHGEQHPEGAEQPCPRLGSDWPSQKPAPTSETLSSLFTGCPDFSFFAAFANIARVWVGWGFLYSRSRKRRQECRSPRGLSVIT